MCGLVFPLLCYQPFISSRRHYPHYDRRMSGSFAHAVALLWTQQQWVLTLSSLHNVELTSPSPGTWLWGPLHASLRAKAEWGQVCIEVPMWSGPHQCAPVRWPHQSRGPSHFKDARKYSSPYRAGETRCAAWGQAQIFFQVQNPKASHPSP